MRKWDIYLMGNEDSNSNARAVPGKLEEKLRTVNHKLGWIFVKQQR
jgi:hypothetical protein